MSLSLLVQNIVPGPWTRHCQTMGDPQTDCERVHLIVPAVCPKCEQKTRDWYVIGPVATGGYVLIFSHDADPTVCWHTVPHVFHILPLLEDEWTQ